MPAIEDTILLYESNLERTSPPSHTTPTVPTNPVNVIRLTLNMLKSAFRLSTFRDVLADIFSSEITSLKVYWVCPMSACPTLVGCSSGFDQRIASGYARCLGDTLSPSATFQTILLY